MSLKNLPQGSDKAKPRANWPLFMIAFSPLFLFIALSSFWPWTLVNVVSGWLYSVFVIGGFVLGWWLIDFIGKKQNRDLSVREMFSFPILYAVCFFFFPQYLLQAVAFAGTETRDYDQRYLIIRGGSHKGPSSIHVSPLKRQKTSIRVMSTGDLKGAYGHISTHHKDCLVLQTQLGRNGFERVRTYSLFGERADMRHVQFGCIN